MQLLASNLSAIFNSALSGIYIFHGEEHASLIEGKAAILKLAFKQGFTEKQIFTVDQHFNWDFLYSETLSLSLFASSKILDIQIPNGKIPAKAVTTLKKLLERDMSSIVILITMLDYDRQFAKSSWFNSLKKNAVIVFAKKIGRSELPGWLQKKLKHQSQSGDAETIDFLINNVEGNLVAASQEIKKLGLLLPEGRLSLSDVKKSLTDVARHDVSEIGPIILKGDKAQFVRIMKTLRLEGTAETLVLWNIVREIRSVLEVKHKLDSGYQIDAALSEAKIWGLRKKFFPRILNHLREKEFATLLKEGERIDLILKGFFLGNSWESLINLGLLAITLIYKKRVSPPPHPTELHGRY